MNKHVNPAKHLHEVYTKQGGVQEYNKNQQAVGMLKLAGAILIATKLLLLLDKVENRPIKALKESEYSARDCAPQPLKLSIHSGGIEHPCRCR